MFNILYSRVCDIDFLESQKPVFSTDMLVNLIMDHQVQNLDQCLQEQGGFLASDISGRPACLQ